MVSCRRTGGALHYVRDVEVVRSNRSTPTEPLNSLNDNVKLWGMSNVALIDNFRKNALAAMRRSKITQRAVAAELGVHEVTIHRILKGDISPSLETCEKIAEAVGIRPDTIFLEPIEKAG